MAEDTTAYVIPLHQVPLARKQKDKTGAERAKSEGTKSENAKSEGTKASRPRKKQKPKVTGAAEAERPSSASMIPSDESLIPPEFLPVASATDEAPFTQLPAVIPDAAEPIRPSRRQLAPALLSAAALVLAAVGITINGWFARSLGSSDVAGWLFLAVGVAADLVALVMPSCAAGLWQAGQRATAIVGWAIWLTTFVFAVTAGIGFASTNISDVTLARASRVTPAVTDAQAALADAMAARDRECKSGVGKFCREREAAVTERRQMLDTAMTSVGRTADPQTDAAIKLVAWVSGGLLRPAAEDFAMLRLVLLALLPQIGGILLMVGRRA
jgi:hypothetical protein